MNSDNGGQSPQDAQRRAAAEIARKKVLAAYDNGAHKGDTSGDIQTYHHRQDSAHNSSGTPSADSSDISSMNPTSRGSVPTDSSAIFAVRDPNKSTPSIISHGYFNNNSSNLNSGSNPDFGRSLNNSDVASPDNGGSKTSPNNSNSKASPSNGGSKASSNLGSRQVLGQLLGQILSRKSAKSYEQLQADQQSRLSTSPMELRLNSESWRKYHTAWQDYYQKYYSEYYSNAARDYIAKERLKDAREQAEEDDIAYALARAGGRSNDKTGLPLGTTQATRGDSADADNIRYRLRNKIRRRATDDAKKKRRFRRFIPLIAGLTVVLVVLFLQYNRLIFAPIMAYVSPGNAPASEIDALDPTITQTVSAEPRLIIPKLNIDVPIRFNVALDGVMAAMNNGVAHYRISGASAYPGQIGNFIITGHSAGDVYSSNPYKYIFSGLERLEDGDLIYVNYDSVRYTYKVIKKQVVEPTDVASLVMDTDKPLITLVTCTPLGTSRYRLLVTGEQISPSYDEATTAEQDAGRPTTVIDETELPSNEPSFFEGIWNWLTGQ